MTTYNYGTSTPQFQQYIINTDLIKQNIGRERSITQLTPQQEQELREQGQRCSKECSRIFRPFVFSKCEVLFSGVSLVMIFGGSVLSIVSHTASIAIAYPGIGLLFGVFLKRIFISTYHCVTGCPSYDYQELNRENDWSDWCLCGRASPSICVYKV